MSQVFDILILVVVMLNFVALGVGRLRAVINTVALQGVLLGTLPYFLDTDLGVRGVLLIAGTIVLKGRIIPTLLVRAMREANIRHEVDPVIGFASCLVLGAIGTGAAMLYSYSLPLADEHSTLLLVPASFSTIWTGILLLTTRRRAIMQVLGFLILENGILLFGLLLLEAMPFLVEAGVLLDLFTGVFVMGIIIHHINREFAASDTEALTTLRE